MGTEGDLPKAVDFDQLSKDTVATYLARQDFYRDLAFSVRRIVQECLNKRGIQVHSVQARAKAPASVGRKAAIPSDSDPAKPKYSDPLNQITDLAAVRVITFFPKTVQQIETLLREEFQILEVSDKGKELVDEERFGYHSVHYLLCINEGRAALAEYERFRGAVVEVQIRTILQHSWAEIEHDIQYKSSTAIPAEIRRRFMALAGMLEIADREFQAIQDADQALKSEARSLVSRGELDKVEITADALRAFLDKRLGPDGRLTDFSYDWMARMLKQLGFRTLEQVEKCIAPFNADELSYLAWGNRQGQGRRFEFALLAGMQDHFIERHPYREQQWFKDSCRRELASFREAGVILRCFDPTAA